MHDSRNEREAQPRLQRQADAHYRRYEMHNVPKSWRPPSYRTTLLAAVIAMAIVVAAAIV